MNISQEQILHALSHVDDPDLKKDIVTLKMVENILIEEKKISFTVVLTTPACPLKDAIQQACVNAIHHFIGKDMEVKIAMSSRVTSQRSKNEILPKVRNIIAVASGKGGVGKSTVAVNLALGLVKNGAKVGLLDADIYGPSIPLMLGLQGKKPTITSVFGKTLLVPIEKFGLKTLSIGFLLEDNQAVMWRGPMASSTLKQFITDADWGELDYLVIDLPPGTSDIHLTTAQTVPVTGAVIVTTPQEVSLIDARKAIVMFNNPNIKIPILGLVENMSYFTPEELPDNKYFIFGKDGGKKLAKEFNIPLLAQIPIVQSIREGGDAGLPSVLEEKNLIGKSFITLAQNTAQQIAIRNAKFAEEKKDFIPLN